MLYRQDRGRRVYQDASAISAISGVNLLANVMALLVIAPTQNIT